MVDFYLLPLSGADLVLGVQWLKLLGPVVIDYDKLTMKFFWDGHLIHLKGDQQPSATTISPTQLHRLTSTDSVASFSHLVVLHPPNSVTHDAAIPTVIQQLLSTFDHLFAKPTSLPPTRPTDHRIHLLPHATPVNLRPYRYPHFQKREIEKLVQDMLDTGVIRPSTSAFFAPVLLVKKKDGSRRFCVDYRALNTLTVKDRFLIPTIDELLDELHGASFFSKLDHRAGYHQIRMYLDDVHKLPSTPMMAISNSFLCPSA